MSKPSGGPVSPTAASHARHHPLGIDRVRIADGFWAERRRTNATASIPLGIEQLEASGTLRNLRIAAGLDIGAYTGPAHRDSDVYKLMESAAWQLADGADPDLEGFLDATTDLLEQARESDGYLHSHSQVVRPGTRYTQLSGSHELYCAGHLIQAAVADRRVRGGERLLSLASRLADHLVDEFLTGGNPALDGHPQVETALVELFRETGLARYLDLALHFIDARGQGRAGGHRGPEFCQDHLPVRRAHTVVGHAVRALYLEAGVVDVFLETGDETLLSASMERWHDMVATRTALTGGHGSRLLWEAFGDRYELPPDLSYNETCAAVATIGWSWRMLLATGDARYSELIERVLYNVFAASVSFDGRRYFKGNPLQRRPDHQPFEGVLHRQEWFDSACCPPNVTRLLASLPHYVATTMDDGLAIQQYVAGTVDADVPGGPVRVAVDTQYPWHGNVDITIQRTPPGEWTLSLRIPSWSGRTSVVVAGAEQPVAPGVRTLDLRRRWHPGETVRLALDLTPRVTRPHPAIDALRGCVAIERGPLVYCFESIDQPAGVGLDGLELDPEAAPTVVERTDPVLGRTTTIETNAHVHGTSSADGLPYFAAPPLTRRTPVTAVAIPYAHWDNRPPDQNERNGGAMRVWVPASTQVASET